MAVPYPLTPVLLPLTPAPPWFAALPRVPRLMLPLRRGWNRWPHHHSALRPHGTFRNHGSGASQPRRL